MNEVRVRSAEARRALAAALEQEAPELLQDIKAFGATFGKFEEVHVELDDEEAQNRLRDYLLADRERCIREEKKRAETAIAEAKALLQAEDKGSDHRNREA